MRKLWRWLSENVEVPRLFAIIGVMLILARLWEDVSGFIEWLAQ